jgi:hypothetical protein
LIDASDDFEVVQVKVALRDAEGGTVFAGEASLKQTQWYFNVPPAPAGAKSVAQIEVTAFDRPGNATTRTFLLPGTATV